MFSHLELLGLTNLVKREIENKKFKKFHIGTANLKNLLLKIETENTKYLFRCWLDDLYVGLKIKFSVNSKNIWDVEFADDRHLILYNPETFVREYLDKSNIVYSDMQFYVVEDITKEK